MNVVTGSARAIGGELTANPDVQKVTFTGSTEIGKVLMRHDSSGVVDLAGLVPLYRVLVPLILKESATIGHNHRFNGIPHLLHHVTLGGYIVKTLA